MTPTTTPAPGEIAAQTRPGAGEGRPGDRLRRAALAVLAVPGIAGAVLSWESMRTAAAAVFDPRLAVAFPALVDALALGAALRWVASVRDGTPITGWRVTAHTAVGASILLNALAANTLGQVPWHVTAPAVWSALVELFARDMARAWQHATRHDPTARDRIPARLWLLAPRESATTWIRQARTGQTSAIAARVDADRIAAAITALRVSLPGRRHRRTRREIIRRLAAGTLPPSAVPAVLGWTVTPDGSGQSVIRAATRAALTGSGDRRTEPTDPPDPTRLVSTDSIGSRAVDRVPTRSESGRSSIESVRSNSVPPCSIGPGPNPTPAPPQLAPPGSGATNPTTAGPDETGAGVRARAADVAALRAALAKGHLPERPSVEAIRTHLKISAPYARAARKALSHPTPSHPSIPLANKPEQAATLETRITPENDTAAQQNTNSENHSSSNSDTHSRNHHQNHDQHQQESQERIPRSTTPLHLDR